jgi:hypothetical protein
MNAMNERFEQLLSTWNDEENGISAADMGELITMLLYEREQMRAERDHFKKQASAAVEEEKK